MVKQWGKKLRWVKVPEPVNKSATKLDTEYVSDNTIIKPIKRKK